jgi:hypothetical protein
MSPERREKKQEYDRRRLRNMSPEQKEKIKKRQRERYYEKKFFNLGRINRVIDNVFPINSNFSSNKNKVFRLKHKLKDYFQNFNIKSNGGKTMENETVNELVSLRRKGVLTEEELLLKLDGLNGEQAESVSKPTPSNPNKQWRNHKKWSSEEEKRLLELRERGNSWSTIGKLMGRKRVAVCGRYFLLTSNKGKVSSSQKHKVWQKSEDDYLKMMYKKMPTNELAKSLKRTPESVRCRAKGIGIAKRQKPSDTVKVGEYKFPRKYSVKP